MFRLLFCGGRPSLRCACANGYVHDISSCVRSSRCDVLSRNGARSFGANKVPHGLLEVEQPAGVCGRLGGKFFQSDPARVGQTLCSMNEHGRFIGTVSAVRVRCQVGRIGFDKETIGGHLLSDFSQRVRLLESDHAREADEKSEFQALPGSRQITGEGVHDAP